MSSKAIQERAAARTARRLVREIHQRRLPPGARLDAEHRMVEDLGVARGTVREALRFLELQGALRIKAGPGGGPVVSVPGAEHLASLLSLHLQFVDASFRSVVDARCSIYPVLAAEAAANASREDVAALRESIDRMHRAGREQERFTGEARRFMALVATASGNRVLALLVDALHQMSDETGVWNDRQRRSVLRSYEKVVAAIEGGQPERARSIMETSLLAAVRHWEQAAPDQLEQPVVWLGCEG